MFKGIILAIGGACTLLVAYLAAVAMLQEGGSVTVHFNKYNEGWLELILFGVVALLYPWAMWTTLRLLERDSAGESPHDQS